MRLKRSIPVLCLSFILLLSGKFTPAYQAHHPSPEPMRINTGGVSQSVNGVFWSGCNSLTNCGGFVAAGNPYTKNPLPSVSGVQPPANLAIYQTEWTGGRNNGIPVGGVAFTFNIPVHTANNLVRLHFSENNQDAIGKRVFDVRIEGVTVLGNFDLFKEAGGMYKTYVREFPVTAQDGSVTIEFIARVENAKISAIEVLPVESSTPIPPTATPTSTPTATPTPTTVIVPTSTPTTAPTAIPQPKSALLVVGDTTLSSADTALKSRLEQLGYQVTVAKDSDTSAAQANGKNLVFVSSTVASASVNTKFRAVPVPVLSAEPYIYDDMGMTSGSGLGFQQGQNALSIINPAHPLAAGLSGTSAISSSANDITWGIPTDSAVKVAVTVGDASRVTLFGYDQGAAMIGLTAPARRVGLFMSNNTADTMSADGWKLFDAAVTWAVQPVSDNPTPTFTAALTSTPLPSATPSSTLSPTPHQTTINWSNKAVPPLSRTEAQGVGLNGKLYVFGGFYTGDLKTAKASHVFNPATNTWSIIADMPEALTHSPVVTDGQLIYVLGGFVGDHPGGSTGHVWIYNPASNTWSAGPSLPARRGSGGAAIIGRSIHFFGGTLREPGSNVYVDYSDHWVLNLDNLAGGWQSRAPLPTKRNHLAGIGLNGKVYAIGGQLAGAENSTNQNVVEVYDPATDSWSAAAPMPTARGHITSSIAVYNNQIYVIGGSVNGGEGGLPSAAVEIYNPATNTWRKATNLPTGVKTPVADIINGRINSTGGSGSSMSNWEGVLINP